MGRCWNRSGRWTGEPGHELARPHTPRGLCQWEIRAIPNRALRQAVVNGVVHRDWLSSEPTAVEHIGDTLTVTSPGGLIGGLGPYGRHVPCCCSASSEPGRSDGLPALGRARGKY
jgi:hypothetical protein